MRPDEHKKKKNAQYKKKHGIKDHKDDDKKSRKPAAAQSAESSSRGATASASATTATSCGASASRGSAPSSGPASETHTEGELTHTLNQEVDDGLEDELSHTHDKKYSKRSLESNWQRYEMPPEDQETQSSSTKDFSILLESSVDALTQFRFKEEQEWQRDLDEAGPDPSQLLSIDCVALAKALSCIPLHKRLGIEESVFESSQVAEFERQARENSALNEALTENDSPKDVTAETKATEPSTTVPQDTSHETAFNDPADNVLDELLGHSAKPSALAENLLDELLSCDSHETKPPDSSSDCKLPPPSQTQIISLESERKSVKCIDIEDELDKLLSVDEKASSLPPKTTQGASKSNEADFEDWLDSILDE